MKKIFVLVLLFFTTFAHAQTARPTSFDDRPICEENKAIWREFGNGCADNCVSKFDKYEVCTQASTYACDCGRGRCWHENKCLKISEYKKIFDKENAAKEKILEARKEEREARIKNDPNLKNYLQNLYVNKEDTKQNPQNKNGQNPIATTGQNQNTANSSGQNQAALTPAVQVQQNQNTQQLPQIAAQPLQQLPAGAITQVQNNAPAQNVSFTSDGVSVKVPSFFAPSENKADVGAPPLPVIPLPQ